MTSHAQSSQRTINSTLSAGTAATGRRQLKARSFIHRIHHHGKRFRVESFYCYHTIGELREVPLDCDGSKHLKMPLHQPSESITKAFVQDLKNRHLIYDYGMHDVDTGNAQKWRYEMWFYNEDRVVYAIHGGPMAGRANFQTATYQCLRPGELWQCNWLEETGTIVSLIYDIINKKITTLIAFSKGHWENAEAAHGDKRNPADMERWRALAKIGIATDRYMVHGQADILEDFTGQGELEGIQMDWPTM